jgi:hypothetical protein
MRAYFLAIPEPLFPFSGKEDLVFRAEFSSRTLRTFAIFAVIGFKDFDRKARQVNAKGRKDKHSRSDRVSDAIRIALSGMPKELGQRS